MLTKKQINETEKKKYKNNKYIKMRIEIYENIYIQK